jgi:hypothetical protein
VREGCDSRGRGVGVREGCYGCTCAMGLRARRARTRGACLRACNGFMQRAWVRDRRGRVTSVCTGVLRARYLCMCDRYACVRGVHRSPNWARWKYAAGVPDGARVFEVRACAVGVSGVGLKAGGKSFEWGTNGRRTYGRGGGCIRRRGALEGQGGGRSKHVYEVGKWLGRSASGGVRSVRSWRG